MMRGEIWWADLGIPFGSEPGLRRPVVIMQDDSFNQSNIGTTIVVSLSTNLALADAPGNVYIEKEESNLSKNSVINITQISTLDKNRLIKKVGNLSKAIIDEIDEGTKLVMGLL